MLYQMGPSYGDMPVSADDYPDDYARNVPWKAQPRIDLKGHEDGYLLARNMPQEVGPNSLAGKPYKLDTVMFYLSNYGDVLIEIGKRIMGPMGEYYKALGDTENVIRHLAKGFEQGPGDNGVNSFESWKEKGVWY